MIGSTPKLFICYRREETAAHAGRLYDAVAARFGERNVFMDIELEPGIDFVDRIGEVVGACHVFLVVVGPTWATLQNGGNRPRIADREDFVRLEVETALRRRDVRVIPLLVGGARMPHSEDLPEELRTLTRRNALELSDLRWRYDIGRLMGTLGPRVRPGSGLPRALQARSQLAASIRHPNVISIYRAGEFADQLFITMDYVEGTDLKAIIAVRGRLDPKLAASLVAQVAGGLDAAHARGLVHRDVKPANVLIENRQGDQRAYLTDFGLTKRAASGSALTKTGWSSGRPTTWLPSSSRAARSMRGSTSTPWVVCSTNRSRGTFPIRATPTPRRCGRT